MSELLSCPFCGGHATSYGTRKMESGGSTHCLIHCDECSARLSAKTEAEAVAAWDRRAERTCRMVDCSTNDTCVVNCELCNGDVMSMEFGYKQCSECGAYVFDCPTVRYCPSCGAKVEVNE